MDTNVATLTFDTNTYIFMVASLSNIGGIDMAFAFNDIFGGDYSLRYFLGGFNNANPNDALYPSYFVNGGFNASINYSNIHVIDGSLNTTGSSVLRLSSDFYSGGRYFNGAINEVIIYNGPTRITNAQIMTVRNYLMNKWSI
jgi:hypothetical protein